MHTHTTKIIKGQTKANTHAKLCVTI